METEINAIKKTARLAGLWYLLLVIVGIYGLLYVQSQIFADGNMAITLKNILGHQFLFRTGIFSNIIGNFIFLFLVLSLYKLLKNVNEGHAKLMLVFLPEI